MSSNSDLTNAAGTKLVLKTLDELMVERGVSEDTRSSVLTCIQMMYEYIPYAIKQGKNPTDKTVLRDFLQSKGQHLASMMGNEQIDCGLALIDFIGSAKNAMSTTSTGAIPFAALAWTLALVDLIDVGNSCPAVQQATYEIYYKNSSVENTTTKNMVQQRYSNNGTGIFVSKY